MTDLRHAVLHFDDFALDTGSGVLRVAASEILLRPKTAAVLEHLLRHAGHVVPREALLDAVWPGLVVTDDSLTQCISEIRRALGRQGAAMLRTLPRRGYMLTATLREGALPPAPVPAIQAPPAPPAPARLPLLPAALMASMLALMLSIVSVLGVRDAPAPGPAARELEELATRSAEALVAQGRARIAGPGGVEARLRDAIALFNEALARDPRASDAAAELAFSYTNLLAARISTDPAADLAAAERFAALAMRLAPDAPIALHAQAAVLRHQGRFAEALPLFERAGQDPDRLTARASVGLMHLLLGAPERALAPLETLLVEAPEHHFAGTWRIYLGLARLLGGIGDHGAADFAAMAPRGTIFTRPERLAHQLAALSLNGDADAALRVRALLAQLAPDLLNAPVTRFAMSREPAYLARFEEMVAAPLRQWGWVGAGR